MASCPICGKSNPRIDHRCPDWAIRKIERKYRREESQAELESDSEPTFDERLEEGFRGAKGE